MQTSRIIATGAYLPSKILSNNDLAKLVDTSDEWIYSRTGIKQRHIASNEEVTSDLAALALSNALTKSGIKKETLDAIIVATTTPDVIFPATAVYTQHKAGIKQGFAFDINAVCSGFVYAYITADALVRSGQAKRVAVIGADIMTRIIDWNDRKTCVLFGDGAGAVIIEASDQSTGVMASEIFSDGSLAGILNVAGGVAAGNLDAKLYMEGREVYKHAVEKMTSTITSLIQKANLQVTDLDWLVPHQANIRILDAVAQRVGMDKEKMVATVDQHANTSAATIPLALDNLNESGKLLRGNKLAFVAAGAGLTWGGLILKF